VPAPAPLPPEVLAADPPVRRVLIECTRTWFQGGNTGIQRVVRNVVRHSAELGRRRGIACEPLVLAGFGAVRPRRELRARPHWVSHLRGYLLGVARAALGLVALLIPGPVRRWLVRRAPRGRLARLRLRLSSLARSAGQLAAGILSFPMEFLLGRRIEPGPGDLVLLADASWSVPGLGGFLADARARGARVGAIVYDLIPIEHPAVCAPTTRSFVDWIGRVAEHADLVLTISEATRRSLADHLARSEHASRSPRLGVFRLGTELDLAAPGGAIRTALAAALDPEHPLYLVVGTVEPRKNHALVLDAFEERWARGSDARLLVAGRRGWESRYVVERMRLHTEHGRRLFFFEDLSDSELACAYDRATAVVCASFAEGFGLPLVEALSRGVPVFASDIDAHREVGGKHVVCFERRSPAALAAALEAFEASGRLPDGVQPPETFRWPDWWESSAELLDEVQRLSRALPRPPAPPGR